MPMPSKKTEQFDSGTQLLLALYALLIAFPILEVPGIGVSLSFPVFLVICVRAARQASPLFGLRTALDKLIACFALIAMVSVLLAPPTDRGQSDLLLIDAKSAFHLLYWVCVFLFFSRWYRLINMQWLSLGSLAGLAISSTFFLVGTPSSGGNFMEIGPLRISLNGYAFNAVATLGISSLYLVSRFGLKGVLLIAVPSVHVMLLSGSRTGGLLLVAELILIGALVLLSSTGRPRTVLAGVTVLLAAFTIPLVGQYGLSGTGAALGERVAPHNARIAGMLQDAEQVNRTDKSWLTRRAMIEKAMDLFGNYPILGVGWGHFTFVRADIDLVQYRYLRSGDEKYLLHRGSHNSYAAVLAETGILGASLFGLIVLVILARSAAVFLGPRVALEPALLGVSVLAVLAYFWVIAAITGAVWYFVLGLYIGAANEQRRSDEAGEFLVTG